MDSMQLSLITASVDPIPDPPLIWKFQIDGAATDVTAYSAGQRLEFYYPENTSAPLPFKFLFVSMIMSQSLFLC